MALGDVTSNQRGSGARYNDGKPDLSLIPLTLVAGSYRGQYGSLARRRLVDSLFLLGVFQTTGSVDSLHRAIELMSGSWADAARVFEYGRNKYAAWNWAKGMQWSAPIACAGRHALKVLEYGEMDDDESLLPHVGHYLCNLVMLATFVTTYPEGNDLPAPELFCAPPTPQLSLSSLS